MASSFENYDKFLYIEKDDGIHLYVGITKDKEIASRIKDYYEKKGYSIYIKESILDNQSFLSILGEYDKIIGITGDNDLKGIEEIVISNYKEMVLESEN